MSVTNDKMKFAEKIYKYRKASRLTQKQFSKLMGVSVPTLKNYETGEAIPDAAFLARFSIMYNVSPDDVLNMDKYENIEAATKLVSDGVEADEQTKKDVADIIKQLRGE